jgi:hypothetical protein
MYNQKIEIEIFTGRSYTGGQGQQMPITERGIAYQIGDSDYFEVYRDKDNFKTSERMHYSKFQEWFPGELYPYYD